MLATPFSININPKHLAHLVTDLNSPIIDLFPTNFFNDMDNKRVFLY